MLACRWMGTLYLRTEHALGWVHIWLPPKPITFILSTIQVPPDFTVPCPPICMCKHYWYLYHLGWKCVFVFSIALAEKLAWLSARKYTDLVTTNIRARFNINTLYYPYRGYHYKDKTRPPCPHLMPRIPMQYISWYVYTDHLLLLHRYWVIMGSCMGNNPDKYGFMEHINLLIKNTWATAKQPKSNPCP